MIKLFSITLKNFLSYKDATLSLENPNPLVLIEGRNSDGRYDSNGSGKSSLLEALVYSLTGNTLRGVSVNDVVNRNVGKDTSVELLFSVDDVHYQVTRYRAHTVKGDSLILVREGKDISKRITKDTQALLDSILGIPYSVLISVVFLGEGLSSKFTQLSDPDKKSLLESTLNLPYDFSKLQAMSNEKLKATKLEVANLEGQVKSLQSILDSKGDETEDPEVFKTTKLSEKDSLLRESQDVAVSLESISPKVKLLEDSMSQHRNLSTLINQLDRQATSITDRITSVESAVDPVCPQCHQPLSDPESKLVVLEDLNSQLSNLARERTPLYENFSKLPEYSSLLDTHSKLQAKWYELSQRGESIRTALNKIEMDIQRADHDLATRSHYAQYESTVRELTEKSRGLSKVLEEYSYMYSLFSPTGLMIYILEESVKYVNERLRIYSEILLDKSYEIVFKKGKIGLVDSSGSTYQSLSNGEKRRLDISIQFSLHDYVNMYCGIGIDTLFIDEVLDTLDSIGVRNIIEVLRVKLDYCDIKRVYLITHNGDIKNQVDSCVTVVKDSEGISHLVEEEVA